MTPNQANLLISIAGTLASVLSLGASFWALKASRSAKSAADQAARMIDESHRMLKVHSDLVPQLDVLRREVMDHLQKLTSGQLDREQLSSLTNRLSDIAHQAAALHRPQVQALLVSAREASKSLFGSKSGALASEPHVRKNLDEIGDALNQSFHLLSNEPALPVSAEMGPPQ